MEKNFRATISYIESYNKINLRKYFIQRFDTISYFLLDCHKLTTKIIRRFVTFRLKIHLKKTDENSNNVTYASKKMAMHIRTKYVFFLK